jgi:hypothetical protein
MGAARAGSDRRTVLAEGRQAAREAHFDVHQRRVQSHLRTAGDPSHSHVCPVRGAVRGAER